MLQIYEMYFKQQNFFLFFLHNKFNFGLHQLFFVDKIEYAA